MPVLDFAKKKQYHGGNLASVPRITIFVSIFTDIMMNLALCVVTIYMFTASNWNCVLSNHPN